MISQLFSGNAYKEIAEQLRAFLNSQRGYLALTSLESPRAVGDAIQDLISRNFIDILRERVKNYTSVFARRAMADLAFEDEDNFYYVVDVKTHRLSTKFNMPNLISVERLTRFYDDDKNYFVLLLVKYDVADAEILVESVRFIPIEFLDWSCLTIGALGWGQIQIANANTLVIEPDKSRRMWLLQLFDTLLEFYPREISKIEGRLEHFRRARQKWAERTDI